MSKGETKNREVPRRTSPYAGAARTLDLYWMGPCQKLTESAGKNAILCITDLFSKAIKLEAVTTKIMAKRVTRIFWDWVFREEGLLTKIYSDRGPQFARHFMKELMGLLHVKLNISTPYHPQTDRQTE